MSLWKQRRYAGAIALRHIAGEESSVQFVTTLPQEQRPVGGNRCLPWWRAALCGELVRW